MSPKKIHHIGIAVQSIEAALEFQIQVLGMEQVSDIVYDPIQRVRVVLLASRGKSTNKGSMVELVEPMDHPSPIDGFLKQKNHLYHYCIETSNIEEAISKAESCNAIVVQRPVKSVLFNGRRVAFIWSHDRYLVEFLEKK